MVVGGAGGGLVTVGSVGAPRRSPRRSLEMGAPPPPPAELTPDQGAMLQHLSAGASHCAALRLRPQDALGNSLSSDLRTRFA